MAASAGKVGRPVTRSGQLRRLTAGSGKVGRWACASKGWRLRPDRLPCAQIWRFCCCLPPFYSGSGVGRRRDVGAPGASARQWARSPLGELLAVPKADELQRHSLRIDLGVALKRRRARSSAAGMPAMGQRAQFFMFVCKA
jgi:hypothetical protein